MCGFGLKKKGTDLVCGLALGKKVLTREGYINIRIEKHDLGRKYFLHSKTNIYIYNTLVLSELKHDMSS